MDSTTARIGNLILSSPISQALEIPGDRWSFLTLRDLFLGRHRFGEFVTSTGASRSTLANRLNTLQAHGLVYKTLYHENPPRYEYRLREKGLALYNFALAIWAWETRWSGNPTSVMPIQLYHEPCANHFLPKPICSHCGSEVHIKSSRFWALSDAILERRVRLDLASVSSGREEPGLVLTALM